MKKIIIIIIITLNVNNMNAQYGEESRYKIEFVTNYMGKQIKINADNVTYNLGNNIAFNLNVDSSKSNNLLDNIHTLNLTLKSQVTSEFFKLFEKKNQVLNGYIEIIDSYGKEKGRKIIFDNASYYVSGSFSYVSYCAITIYCKDLIIDGIKID